MKTIEVGTAVGDSSLGAFAPRHAQFTDLEEPFRTPVLASSLCTRGVLDYRKACELYLEPIANHLRSRLTATGFVREVIDYQLQTGGKRLRALLPVWVCINFGGRAQDAFDSAIALELFHNASLIQDDIEDGDSYRRGQPTVWHRWGAAQAINVSSALIFEAIIALARGEQDTKLVRDMGLDLLRLIEGQALDLGLLDGSLPPSLSNWIRMARCKTGMFFAACMRAGLKAAGVDATQGELTAACLDYAVDIGLTFQVQDDLLDLVGNKRRETRASDLVEGKLSFPIAWALENADPSAILPLQSLLALKRPQRTPALVERALQALDQCGALHATADWLRRALRAGSRHPVTGMLPGLLETVVAPVSEYLRTLETLEAT